MLWSARHRPDANAEYTTLVLNPSRGRPLRESGCDAVECDRLDITVSVLPETTVHVELANTVQKRNTRTEIASGKNGTGFEIVVAWQRFIGKPSSCPGVEEVQPNIAAICDRRSPGDAILPTNGRKLIITQYELHKDLVPVCVDRRTGGNKKKRMMHNTQHFDDLPSSAPYWDHCVFQERTLSISSNFDAERTNTALVRA